MDPARRRPSRTAGMARRNRAWRRRWWVALALATCGGSGRFYRLAARRIARLDALARELPGPVAGFRGDDLAVIERIRGCRTSDGRTCHPGGVDAVRPAATHDPSHAPTDGHDHPDGEHADYDPTYYDQWARTHIHDGGPPAAV